MHEGHPHSERVFGLLHSVREDMQRLFRKVTEFNDAHPEYEGRRTRVTFYFGQNVVDREDRGEHEESTPSNLASVASDGAITISNDPILELCQAQAFVSRFGATCLTDSSACSAARCASCVGLGTGTCP